MMTLSRSFGPNAVHSMMEEESVRKSIDDCQQASSDASTMVLEEYKFNRRLNRVNLKVTFAAYNYIYGAT